MNVHDKTLNAGGGVLIKADASSPCLIVKDREVIAIRAGTIFKGVSFSEETILELPKVGLVAGRDYVVLVDQAGGEIQPLDGIPDGDLVLGGFHFAPGGNAPARAGGDAIPAANPYSAWDRNFRPACPDPRGMSCVEGPRGKFWCDIYMLGVNHVVDGTSKFGATIADGRDPPRGKDGSKYKRFDYAAAMAVMEMHGKGLLALDEFFAAAYGVTEMTAHDGDPVTTQCDPARTSKWGVMQASGNLWVWGHDSDPDTPRASVFGGSWWYGEGAGSRYAGVGDWPDDSNVALGARGRSDHLQLG